MTDQMDPKTETALRQSVEKWRKNSRVRKLGNAKVGAEHCPLCLLFNDYVNPDVGEGCNCCPVKGRTGHAGCVGTPYEDAEGACDEESFRAAAKEELAFLESLLPEQPLPPPTTPAADSTAGNIPQPVVRNEGDENA